MDTNQYPRGEETRPPSSPSTPTPSTPETTPRPTTTPPQSGIDQRNWQEYKNSHFSMRLPDAVKGTNLCQNPPQGKEVLVPVKGYSAPNNIFYIGTAYHFEDHASKECVKIEHSEHYFATPNPKANLYWTVHVKTGLEKQQDILNFVQERYGKGCEAGERSVFEEQNNLHRYGIRRDATKQEDCKVSGREVFLYHPVKKVGLTFGKAQDTTFISADDKKLDDEMVKTIRFVD